MSHTLESVRKLVTDSQKRDAGRPNPNAERFAQIAKAPDQARAAGYQPGERLGRMFRALPAADFCVEKAIQIIADQYGDRATADEISRTMSQQNPEHGGYLVPETYTDEFIGLIRDQALLTQFMPRILPNPTGTLHMSRQSTGVSVAWKAPEGGTIKASHPKFGRVTFRDKTCTILVPVANKLIRTTNGAIDRFVDSDIRAAFAHGIDRAGFFGAGGEWEPDGLFTKIIKMTGSGGVNTFSLATVGVEALVDAIVKHYEALGTFTNLQWAFGPSLWGELMKEKDGNGNFYLMNEMSRGTLMGIPFKFGSMIGRKSANVSYAALADWNEYLILPTRPLEIAKSDVAAYYDATGTLTAAFGTDETVVRGIWSGDMGPRRLNSFTLCEDAAV